MVVVEESCGSGLLEGVVKEGGGVVKEGCCEGGVLWKKNVVGGGGGLVVVGGCGKDAERKILKGFERGSGD